VNRRGTPGSAGAEYLALIGVIIILMSTLLIVHPRRATNRPPVDVITPVTRLLGDPAAGPPRARPAPNPPSPPGTPRAPRSARHRTDRAPIVLVPTWWR
jgi:hypothetical protein